MNNGGIRADLAAGPLTYGQLFTVMPFQNQMVSVTVTGAQLREVMEDAITASGPDAHISGLTVTYDSTRPAGHRVLEVRLAERARSSRIATGIRSRRAISWRLARAGTPCCAATPQSAAGMNDIEAVELYLRRLPRPVRPPEDPRFVQARR